MKIFLSLFLGLIITSNAAMAQDNHGYYGKKGFLEISSSSYIPIIYNVTNQEGVKKLSPSGTSLVRSYDWLNVGARVSVGCALESNVGIALEVGYDQFSLADNVLSYYNSSYNVRAHESLRIHSLLILPRIEISGPNGLLPNGLVHQIGVGATINSVVKRNYLIEYSGGGTSGGPNGNPEDQEELFKEYRLNGSMKMFQLMYGLKMRTPVTKSLMINYGFRYTLDFGLASLGGSNKYREEIVQYQFRNLIAFDLGVILAF